MTFPFAATPALFTKTAIEAAIQDQGFAAQSAVAGIFVGTPLFVTLSAAAWGFYVYRAWVASTLEGHRAEGVLYRLGALTLGMLLGWSLLGLQTSGGLVAGPMDAPNLDEAWQDLPGVASRTQYDSLQNPSRALWGFAMLNGAFEEMSAVLSGAVGLKSDPTDLAKTLMKFQATTLGEQQWGQEVLRSFDALARNCPTDESVMLEQGGELRDLFVTDTQVVGTDENGQEFDCATLWHDFDDATKQVAAGVNAGGIDDVASEFGWLRLFELNWELFGLSDEEAANWTSNVLIEGTLKRAAKNDHTGINPLRKDIATFSEGWPQYIVDVLVDGAFNELALNAGSSFGPNLHLMAQKSEATRRFNEIADLIPTLRGFLFAGFAMAFPLCAYGLALGWSSPIRHWLLGRAVLALYMPAATLLHSVVSHYSKFNGIADNPELSWLTSEAVVVGALAVMEDEALRIQTAYLLAEVAVFTSFALGAGSYLLVRGVSPVGGVFSGFGAGTAASVKTTLASKPAAMALGRGTVRVGGAATRGSVRVGGAVVGGVGKAFQAASAGVGAVVGAGVGAAASAAATSATSSAAKTALSGTKRHPSPHTKPPIDPPRVF